VRRLPGKIGRLAGVALTLLAASESAPRSDVRPLTLYQMTARAALVVHARALSDSTRRPPMQILEVFKGRYPRDRLLIVPFEQNFANPKPWLRREVFRKGVEYFLFLNSYDPDSDDDAFPLEDSPEDKAEVTNRYVVLNAHRGVVAIPPEGGAAITAALKRFVKILSLRQYDLQAEALRALLRERNPFLVEAGLSEVERFRLGTDEEIEALLELIASPRDGFREGAVRLIGQIARRARSEERDLRRREEIFNRVAALAQGDSSSTARLEAVRTLGSIGGADAESLLRAVGRQDASQEVRYQAQIMLLEMSGGLKPPGNRR
jgi:hypothetical protein